MSVLAAPARQGLIKYSQPNGDTINIMIRGDEFGYIILSEDNHLLVNNNGCLEYASFGEDGVPKTSGVIVGSRKISDLQMADMQSKQQLEDWISKVDRKRLELMSKRYKIASSHLGGLSTRSEDNDDESNRIKLNFGKIHNHVPLFGDQKLLVILVEYKDVKFTTTSYDYFYRMLNDEEFHDYDATGSVKEWLKSNSNGQYNPQFDVYGPIELPERRKFYGANSNYELDSNAYMMGVHALQIIDPDVDLSDYDCDGDGEIDNVFIIYAGYAESDSYIDTAVWPHFTFIDEFTDEEYTYDGVKFVAYGCNAERCYKSEYPEGIGGFAHEFSHVLGLPDLYSPLFAFTPGYFSVLDMGESNNESRTPPYYSCFERGALGWLDFNRIEEGDNTLPPLGESNVAYAMPTEKDTELYLFENRQQTGFDTFLPGHGMLVWHIDYIENPWINGYLNMNENHQLVDIVEADNIRTSKSTSGDTFPGESNITSFGFNTIPKLASWSGQRLEFDLVDISESEDGMISFKAVKDGAGYNGIPVIEETPNKGDNLMYDILGRPIKNPQKGIYIMNGKKYCLK